MQKVATLFDKLGAFGFYPRTLIEDMARLMIKLFFVFLKVHHFNFYINFY